MRAVIQRLSWGRVVVAGETVGEIKRGLLVLLGVGKGDGEREAELLAKKITELRIFADADDKMNLSLKDIEGECLVVSQFTLYADTSRGRRPYFGDAEEPSAARALCDRFSEFVRTHGIKVAGGRFGAMMQVEFCNDGPVTIVLDTANVR